MEQRLSDRLSGGRIGPEELTDQQYTSTKETAPHYNMGKNRANNRQLLLGFAAKRRKA